MTIGLFISSKAKKAKNTDFQQKIGLPGGNMLKNDKNVLNLFLGSLKKEDNAFKFPKI